MSGNNLLERVALGAIGGFVGTFAIQAMLAASKKWAPALLPPLREEPGQFMVETAEAALPDTVRDQVPEAVESAAARMLGIGYGVTFGALYGALRSESPSILSDGVVLGTVTWAAGYLGWLPALNLMPPVWKQSLPQAVAPVIEHAVYGVVAVAVSESLRSWLRMEDVVEQPTESLYAGE